MAETESGDELQTRLLEAARLSEEERDAEALDLLLEAEEDHPDDPVLLCMIGALAGHLGAEGMAVDFFTRCLAREPTDAQILLTAGAGLAAMGDPGAESALRTAAVMHPDLAAARMHYGSFLVRSGLGGQGIEELLEARRLDPESPDVRKELGIAYLLERRGAEALEELESAAAAAPDDPELRVLWGLALIDREDLERAAEEVHPIAEMAAEDGELQLLFALLFGSQEWEEQAWLAVSRAEAAEPPIDRNALREVEEALEAGPDAARELLVGEFAPSALRDRIFLA